MNLPHLAQRLFNVPLALHPAKSEIIMASLAARFGIGNIVNVTAGEDWGFDEPGMNQRDGYSIVADVAVIPVKGTLVQKLGTLRPYSGMTGYDGIRQNFLTALSDPKAQAIVLDIDSPGGEVSGCFDLADTIYQARGEKPIWAILNESAFSAAYAIASAADVITVPRTGGTGSVGVIAMHVDFSKALTSSGLQVTIISYGDRKADGAPEIPLSDEARKRFQADVDMMGELFVDTVARNRGIPASAVRETQATTFLGAKGLSVGFADAVMPPDAAFLELLNAL